MRAVHLPQPAAEIEAGRARVDDRHFRAGGARELDDRHADRPGADDERELARPQVRALHRVGADGERLDQRELFVGEPVGRVQLARRDGDHFAHATVLVDAENRQAAAAVRPPMAAGDARPAIQVRLDRASIAAAELAARLRVDHLDAEFVPEHARIAEERLAAAERMQVGAAHADAMDADERLTLRRGRQTCVCRH